MKRDDLKSSVLPVLNPVTKLIGYSQTPQVTGLEYKEVRDFQKKIAKHPQKINYYLTVIKETVKARQMFDKARQMFDKKVF